jgi:hypothetical protein
MLTTNVVRAYWTAFIASSDTITEIASRRSGAAPSTPASTNRRAARMDAASGAKLRSMLTAP